jgi:hypothetical protein
VEPAAALWERRGRPADGLWTGDELRYALRRADRVLAPALAVSHVAVAGSKVLVATDLGDHRVLDLAVFVQPYCELLRSVWKKAAAHWVGGVPAVAARTAEHPCRLAKEGAPP